MMYLTTGLMNSQKLEQEMIELAEVELAQVSSRSEHASPSLKPSRAQHGSRNSPAIPHQNPI